MTAISSVGRKWPLKAFVHCIILILFRAVPATAQQTDQLEQQLQPLKQQYQMTTREIEQCIDALDPQIGKEKAAAATEAKQKPKAGTVSAPELAAQQAGKGNAGRVGNR